MSQSFDRNKEQSTQPVNNEGRSRDERSNGFEGMNYEQVRPPYISRNQSGAGEGNGNSNDQDQQQQD